MFQTSATASLPEGHWLREALERNGQVMFSSIVTVGVIGDLACYVSGGRMFPEYVANNGDKVDEATARLLYPALGTYRK